MSDEPGTIDEVLDSLPLRHRTPTSWAQLAAADLPRFLADHAVCEQQAALNALNLVAHYPEDAELVDQMSALAAEEAVHLRRVARLLDERGLSIDRRRPNPYVGALHGRISRGGEPDRKIDRLLVGALVEARSCERFTCLLAVLDDPPVAQLLADLGPAERRHWLLFHRLAARETDAETLESRWEGWLEFEAGLVRERGTQPTVHG